MFRKLFSLAAALLALGFSASAQAYDASAALTSARADRANWQKYLPDNVFVAHLSIPGTHDTMTGHKWINNGLATASQGESKSTTQEALFIDQLNGGIRALDFRPGLKDHTIYCGHGVTLTEVTLQSAMQTLCGFIDQHPTEFFFIHLFRGNVYTLGDGGTATLAGGKDDQASIDEYSALIEGMLNPNGTFGRYIIDYNPNLKVSDMRGKIVLLRRDRINFLNLTRAGDIWDWHMQFKPNEFYSRVENHSKPYLNGILHVQDVSSPYEKKADEDIDAEQKYCNDLFYYTRNQVNPNDNSIDPTSYKPFWVMNFTSGEYGSNGGTEGYKANAQIMNKLAVDNLAAAADSGKYGPTGIIFSDYVLIDQTKDGNYNTYGNAIVTSVLENNFHYIADFILDEDKYTTEEDLFGGSTYFLRNVATGKYLQPGANWGTHATVGDVGDYITIAHRPVGSGYNLTTTLNNWGGVYVGKNAYMDSPDSSPWLITDLGDGKYAIHADDNGTDKALGVTNTSTGFVEYTTYTTSDENFQWEIITPEVRLHEIIMANEASEENPIDMTFMMRGAKFWVNCTDNDYWRTNSIGTSAQKTFGGPDAEFTKDWCLFLHGNKVNNGKGNTTAWNITNTISGLPAGRYKLSFECLATDGNPKMKVDGVEIAQHTNNANYANVAAAHAALKASNHLKETAYIEVYDNGTITVELSKGNNTSEMSAVYDNFTLKYYGVNPYNRHAGYFFLRNVGTGKYLSQGLKWGTQGKVADKGMLIELIGNDQDTQEYRIKTPSGYFLLDDNNEFFIDNGDDANRDRWWSFAIVQDEYADLDRFHTIRCESHGNKYLSVVNETTGEVNLVVNMPSNKRLAEWELVSEQDLIRQMCNVSGENHIDASFYTVRGHDAPVECKSDYGWNIDKGGAITISYVGNRSDNPSDNHDYVMQIYAKKKSSTFDFSYNSAFTLTQTINGVPNGNYKFSYQAVTTLSSDQVSVKANGASASSNITNDGNVKSGSAAVTKFADLSTLREIIFEVTDATINLEISKNGTSTSEQYIFFDNFNLTYLGYENEVVSGDYTIHPTSEPVTNYYDVNHVFNTLGSSWGANHIDIADANDYAMPQGYEVTAQRMTYQRSVNYTGTNGWHALYLPFGIEDWGEIASRVITFTGVDESTGEDVLLFQDVDENAPLEAHQLYLVQLENDIDIDVLNQLVKGLPDADYSKSVTTSQGRTYTMHGNYAAKTDMYETGAYALSGNKFMYANHEGIVLKPFRCYLTVSGGQSAQNAPRLSIGIDNGDTNGIEYIDMDVIDIAQPKDDAYYNLQGLRVTHLTPGLYIHNGKKVLIR